MLEPTENSMGAPQPGQNPPATRSEEHTSELQSQSNLVCRLLLEKKKKHDSSPTPSIHPATHAPPPPAADSPRTAPPAPRTPTSPLTLRFSSNFLSNHALYYPYVT